LFVSTWLITFSLITFGLYAKKCSHWKRKKCYRDFDKLSLIWLFNFRLQPISFIAPNPSTNSTHIKNDPKLIILLLLPRFNLNPWYIWYFLFHFVSETKTFRIYNICQSYETDLTPVWFICEQQHRNKGNIFQQQWERKMLPNLNNKINVLGRLNNQSFIPFLTKKNST